MKYIPSQNCLSFIKGFWFVFHDEKAGGSAISGHEYVFFIDELISTIKSMGKTSKHKFKKTASSMKSLFNCQRYEKASLNVSFTKTIE